MGSAYAKGTYAFNVLIILQFTLASFDYYFRPFMQYQVIELGFEFEVKRTLFVMLPVQYFDSFCTLLIMIHFHCFACVGTSYVKE